MKLPSYIPAAITAIAIWLGAGRSAPAQLNPTEILRNMPQNSDFRCVGISLVAAALLEGRLVEGSGCDDPAKLGQQVYDGVLRKSPLQYRPKLCTDDGAVAIQTRDGLEKLSIVVANLYKQRHLELIATELGRDRLRAAMTKVVSTSTELDEILEADPDKIDAFLCAGIRRFADGTFKDTNHAILIAKTPAGDKVVYDPNDPGEAIPCRFHDNEDGVEITWKCLYRDTGQTTIQRYHILRKEVFFRLALARE